MGIGIKKFIELSRQALSRLTINPLDAVTINDDVYVNKKLGILFYKPKN